MSARKVLAAALAVAAAGALAQASAWSPGDPAQVSERKGVNYLCGGVGAEEAAYMKERARQYSLMLTFATRGGAYLADVDVDIRNARGEPVLRANCDGPIMLVELPRGGSYQVHAEAGGRRIDRRVYVAAGTHLQTARMTMLWPDVVGEGENATGAAGDRPRGASGNPAK